MGSHPPGLSFYLRQLATQVGSLGGGGVSSGSCLQPTSKPRNSTAFFLESTTTLTSSSPASSRPPPMHLAVPPHEAGARDDPKPGQAGRVGAPSLSQQDLDWRSQRRRGGSTTLTLAVNSFGGLLLFPGTS